VHLAGAASAPPPRASGHGLIEQLVELVTATEFQAELYRCRFADPAGLPLIADAARRSVNARTCQCIRGMLPSSQDSL
jgi:hypothetical protein